MKKFNTMLCSIAFMIAGIALAITVTSSHGTGYKTMNAATIDHLNPADLPRDFLLGHDNLLEPDTVHIYDTVYQTVHDTVHIVKKFKKPWAPKKKVFEPDSLPRKPLDTLYVSKPVIVIPVVKEEAIDTVTIAQ